MFDKALQRQVKELKAQVETLTRESAQWRELARHLGGYAQQIDERLERIRREMSDQFANVTGALDQQDQAIQNLVQVTSDEAAQVKAAIDELKANQGGNLAPQIQAIADRITASSQRLQTASDAVKGIYEPDQTPTPAPGSKK